MLAQDYRRGPSAVNKLQHDGNLFLSCFHSKNAVHTYDIWYSSRPSLQSNTRVLAWAIGSLAMWHASASN